MKMKFDKNKKPVKAGGTGGRGEEGLSSRHFRGKVFKQIHWRIE